MSTKFRLASFNVENLFSRAKVLNLDDETVGDDALAGIGELQSLLRKTKYTETVKKDIIKLFNGLKQFITIEENRGKLFKKKNYQIVGVSASGAGDWDGGIAFKRAKFSDLSRENTAKVIKAVKADVLCIVEAEDLPSLRAFDSHLLNSRYKYEMLIDATDPRGIDVGLYSKFPIGGVWTHMYKKVFSRDCLEVEIELPNGQILYVLCNHFKSRGYGAQATNDAKRRRQAEEVAEILKQYDLKKDWVVVAGDLNDSPTRPPYTLKPLLGVGNLYDVLELQYPQQPDRRWTYHYKAFEQIDYILVSDPLKRRLRAAGVERRGIAGLKKLTNGQEEEFDSVTHWRNAASDHGAVWAEFGFSVA
jgi:endonuclease/exonuclease/phosphatase family metal-dependent hydrolase